MPINSRNKGACGEREFAELLRGYGHEARRGQQFCGANGDPDVVSDLPIHWEIKRVQNLNIHEAMKKAIVDAGVGKWRAVAHRKNHTGWLITLPADDFFDLIKEWKERSDLGGNNGNRVQEFQDGSEHNKETS
jgi:hypothetical protein